jgi:hypothetical protein
MFESFLRRRPSHATVVAYLALFVALGGSSYAALRVGSGQIVDNSVRSKDIRNNDVRSNDVKNRSLLAKDFKAGQLPAGQKGDAGPTGPTGAQGLPGVSGLVMVATASGAQDSNSGKLAIATCPAGKRVIGTGAQILGDGSGSSPNELTDIVIDEVVPSSEDTVPGEVEVQAVEEEPTAVTWAIEAIALCANVS